MKGSRKIVKSLSREESTTKKDTKTIETEETMENSNTNIIHNESDDHQSSPRGVLEVSESCSDSENSSSMLTFCERSSPAVAVADGDVENINVNDDDEAMEMGSSSWGRNMIDNLKCKSRSLRRFSTGSFMRILGRNHGSSQPSIDDIYYVPKPSSRNFSFHQLMVATNGFNLDNLLGKGGHAEVYRGCLPDGQIVAVKKITKKEKKDKDRVGEFLSELGIIAHINHPNAAKLIGFSSDTDLHLVLHFAPHGSLATLLHNSEENVDWNIRFKIAIGIAEGLQYLHHECNKRIIHRDITASNILLTEDYEPQISDFGLAKWLPDKWAQLIVSPVEGTFGYMAPEYFMHGVIHEKTDVFAFGVLLLELITGCRAVDSHRKSLVIWAKPLLEEGNVKELVDPRLGNDYELIEVKRTIVVASSCIHHMPEMRPNMKRVVQMLKGEGTNVELRQNTFDGRSIIVDGCDLEGYTTTTYLKDLNRHRELVMG